MLVRAISRIQRDQLQKWMRQAECRLMAQGGLGMEKVRCRSKRGRVPPATESRGSTAAPSSLSCGAAASAPGEPCTSPPKPPPCTPKPVDLHVESMRHRGHRACPCPTAPDVHVCIRACVRVCVRAWGGGLGKGSHLGGGAGGWLLLLLLGGGHDGGTQPHQAGRLPLAVPRHRSVRRRQ